MAIVKFIHWSGASGSINGTTYSRNKAGAYIRNRSIPLNPSTTAQTTVRNRLTTNSQGWAGLTDAQRQAWENFALLHPRTNPLGDPRILTGAQVYSSLNNNLAQVGVAPISTPPASAAVDSLDTLSVTASTGPDLVQVAFTPDPVPAGISLIVQATLPVSPGRNNLNNLFRFISEETAATISPADVTTEYTAKFGALIAGQRVGVRCYLVDTANGLVSLARTANTIVT